MNRIPCYRRLNGPLAGWQRGFSLVELMVSMAISLVILAALVAVFVSTSGRNREMERANGMIESGRLAIQVLEDDAVHAGFWGTYMPRFDDQTLIGVPDDAPTTIPDPCLAYDPTTWNAAYQTNLIGIPLQAYDDDLVCSGLVVNKLANTDVLFVRHAETCVPGAVTGAGTCESDLPAGRLYFQSSLCLTDVASYVFDTDSTAFTLLRRDCATLAEKRKFVSNIYYIRNYAVTGGDGIPTLMRAQFDLSGGVPQHQAAVALIEGIDGFNVEFGVDDLSKTGAAVDYTAEVDWLDPLTRTTPTNRGDGAPDGDFVSCTTPSPCTTDQLMNVTAVKFYVLARSREPSRGYTDTKTYAMGGGTTLGPYNDNFKRHVFVTTVRLPNISGRRMTP